MDAKKSVSNIITLGPIGYFPASGTVATLVTVSFLKVFGSNISLFYYTWLIVFLVVLSLKLVALASDFFGREDPPQIVIDEVVGCLFVFWGMDITWTTIIIGTILFRFFDISKLWPINCVEKANSPWGIVLDDIVAGIFAHIVLRLILLFI